MGEIFSLNISSRKGTSKYPIEEAYIEKGFGVRGDAHYGFYHRQVSLLSWEDIEKQNSLLRKNNFNIKLKPGDFAENITTKGVKLSSLKLGDKIKVGSDVFLEVTQIGKKCHDLCEISKKIGNCIMPRQGIFTRVLRGGWVKKGDTVLVLRDENRDNNSK